MQVLVQICQDIKMDLYVCFIDYKNVFDSVKHEKMIGFLENTGTDEKNIRLIANLYWNQKPQYLSKITIQKKYTFKKEFDRDIFISYFKKEFEKRRKLTIFCACAVVCLVHPIEYF